MAKWVSEYVPRMFYQLKIALWFRRCSPWKRSLSRHCPEVHANSVDWSLQLWMRVWKSHGNPSKAADGRGGTATTKICRGARSNDYVIQLTRRRSVSTDQLWYVATRMWQHDYIKCSVSVVETSDCVNGKLIKKSQIVLYKRCLL